MKIWNTSYCILACWLACLAVPAHAQPESGIPHLRKQGTATQLIVDGKPFVALGGEFENDTSTNLEAMRHIWPELVKMNVNFVSPIAYWDLVEPEEGKYDFALVDGIIQEARRNNLRIVFVWFASFKNGLGVFAPLWVKKDFQRFPRAQPRGHTGMELFSVIEGAADATRDADARAFAALMRHIKEVDGRDHTVVMVQVENEVGVLGDSRDRSPAANRAFAGPVPKELLDYLQKHKNTLAPELREVWTANGSKASGTWEQVFGPGKPESVDVNTMPASAEESQAAWRKLHWPADEIFMAWNYARYLDKIVERGKAEYPIPMYVNAWLQQPNFPWPGKYPSGGPVPQVHDVWRAGAPAIDVLAPDLYLPQFDEVSARFTRNGNPLLIAESNGGASGATQALDAVGRGAIAFSVYGIEYNLLWQDPNNDLGKAYKAINQLMPLIVDHQGKEGALAGVLLGENQPEKVRLGDYTLTVAFAADRRIAGAPPRPAVRRAGALFVLTAPDEFYVAIRSETELAVTFTPNTPGPPLVGVGSIDEGSFVDGRWVQGRRLDHRAIANADCNYCQPALLVPAEYYFVAAHSEHRILRVRLYRYQ
jgi:hypothetical protein